MNGAIYVLAWSTGALKVGRSDKPADRIEQHKQAARVFGVSLVEQHTVECEDSAHAESLLIKWAQERASSVERNEWVFGVSYEDAKTYADTLATAKRPAPTDAEMKAALMVDPSARALRLLCETHGRAAVASRINANEQTLYQIVAGIRLQSGKPRSVGRDLRERLDAAFPGWLHVGVAA